MSLAWIGIGSNLGNKKQNIRTALCEISGQFMLIRSSRPIRTKPYGVLDQGDFINLVVNIETTINPKNLLRKLLEIENKMGRIRTKHWGPRKIDLDLLLYDQKIINLPDLILPHPDLHNRLFVLHSLNEIAPNLNHPILNLTMQDLYEKLLANGKQ